MKITFLPSKTVIPLVRFKYNGKSFTAMIDSGSELTFVDKDFALNNKINLKEIDNEVKLNQLTTNHKNKVVVANIDVTMGRSNVHITGMVMSLRSLSDAFKAQYNEDITVDLLIGSDFLDATKAKINFEKKTFTMKTSVK